MMNNGYLQSQQSYQRTKIETATSGELVVMLYDGLIRFLNQAKAKLAEKDIEAGHVALTKSQNIVNELMTTLRPDCGDVSKNLMSLYTFIYGRLVEVNLSKDPAKIDEALAVILPLRNTWAEIVKQAPAAGDTKTDGIPRTTMFSTQR